MLFGLEKKIEEIEADIYISSGFSYFKSRDGGKFPFNFIPVLIRYRTSTVVLRNIMSLSLR